MHVCSVFNYVNISKVIYLKVVLRSANNMNSISYDCCNIHIHICIIPRKGCLKAYKLLMLKEIVLPLAIKHCNYTYKKL